MYSIVLQLYSIPFVTRLNMRPYLKQNFDEPRVNSGDFLMVESLRNQAHFENMIIFKEAAISHDSRRNGDKDEMQRDAAERVWGGDHGRVLQWPYQGITGILYS
jgi:hypothetical protein